MQLTEPTSACIVSPRSGLDQTRLDRMTTLHIIPGTYAACSLRRALQQAGRPDEVMAFIDDLACGPIEPDDPKTRAAWWTQYPYTEDFEASDPNFWDQALASDANLVVWFGRRSALELAFFLAWTDRMQTRPYTVIDVTDLLLPTSDSSGAPLAPMRTPCIGMVYQIGFQTLLDTQRNLSEQETTQAARHWQQLKSENAPFRLATPQGLVSAPIDVFDPLLLKHARTEWQPAFRLVGNIYGWEFQDQIQTGDIMLFARIQALIAAGRLVAEGDPWDRRAYRVRLPD